MLTNKNMFFKVKGHVRFQKLTVYELKSRMFEFIHVCIFRRILLLTYKLIILNSKFFKLSTLETIF